MTAEQTRAYRARGVEYPDTVVVHGHPAPAALLLAADCPHCGVPAGERCRGRVGRLRPSGTHLVRVDTAAGGDGWRR